MNRLLVCIIFVGITFWSSSAHATGITTGSQIKILGSSGSLGGGPFSVDGPDAGNLVDFLTFCLEINEFISYNTPYYVNLAGAAVNGGAGGGNPDHLDSMTAYLYSNFLDGTLAGYDPANSDKRNALQLAVWRIEQEVYRDVDGKYRRADNSNILGNSSMWTAADAFFADASANAVPGSLYGVQVMQLWTGYNPTTGTFSGNTQDQLMRVPDTTSTLSALFIGMVFLGLARMRSAS